MSTTSGEHCIRRGFGLALALTHNEAQAEDLLQDAWVSLLRRGKPPTTPRLLRAVHDRFLELAPRERLVALEPIHGEDGEGGRALDFLDRASSWPDAATLHHALEALAPLEREVVYLASAAGADVGRIAELTGQLPGAVTSLALRARRKLHALLRLPREESRS